MSKAINTAKKAGRPTSNKQIDIKEILEIAILEFADKGFEGAKQRDIAQQAGISKLNYHFKNKEDLWKQAVVHLGEKLKRRFEEAHTFLKDLEGLAELKAYTRQLVYFSAEHPEFYKIVFHEMCTKTERATWLVQNILTPLHGLFDDKNASIQEGSLKFMGQPIANLSSIILGSTNAFFIHSFQMNKMYNVDPFAPEEIENHADMVIDLIFARFEK